MFLLGVILHAFRHIILRIFVNPGTLGVRKMTGGVLQGFLGLGFIGFPFSDLGATIGFPLYVEPSAPGGAD